MEIIGHRGAKGLAPENSLEAIRKALKCRVDMIEIDARVQSGVVVLSHDVVNKSTAYCTLKHALQEIDGKTAINLDIKEIRVVNYLPKILENYNGHIVFSSFSYNTLKKITETMPDAEIAVIENWSGIRAITYATLLNTKRLHINQKWLWHGFVASLKNQGYKVYAYTVNDKKRHDELEGWGVDGIFTDNPNLFC